ncbi:hypothetical protein HPB47_000487, partial [Ixodes persulcatus]
GPGPAVPDPGQYLPPAVTNNPALWHPNTPSIGLAFSVPPLGNSITECSEDVGPLNDLVIGTMSSLAVLAQLLQLAQQQFLQLVLLLQFTLCELVWITLDPYRPLMLLLQQRIL